MADIIQLRRDTAAQWTSVNPVLANGEIGYEVDTRRMKIGDGVTVWASVPYALGNTIVNDNLSAIINPTATDNAPTYQVGSTWVNVTLDLSYICVDSTANAAIWNQIDAAGGGGGGGALADLTDVIDTSPADVGGRYWRILFTDANGVTELGTDEIEFRGAVGGADLTVPGGPATASSFLTGYPASLACDNILTFASSWQADRPYQAEEWWKYDFGVATNIQEYTIAKNTKDGVAASPKAWTIEYSDDDVNWILAGTETLQQSWDGTNTYRTTLATANPAAEGSLMVRSDTVWVPLAAGVSGQYLQTDPLAQFGTKWAKLGIIDNSAANFTFLVVDSVGDSTFNGNVIAPILVAPIFDFDGIGIGSNRIQKTDTDMYHTSGGGFLFSVRNGTDYAKTIKFTRYMGGSGVFTQMEVALGVTFYYNNNFSAQTGYGGIWGNHFATTRIQATTVTDYSLVYWQASNWELTLTGNTAITFNGAGTTVNGTSHKLQVVFIQDATGSRVPTFPASVAWVEGVVPTWKFNAGEENIVFFESSDSGVSWRAWEVTGNIIPPDTSSFIDISVDATLTGDQLAGGLITATPTLAVTYTTPTPSQIFAAQTNSANSYSFEFSIINQGNPDITLVGVAGITFKGATVIAGNTSATYKVLRVTVGSAIFFRL